MIDFTLKRCKLELWKSFFFVQFKSYLLTEFQKIKSATISFTLNEQFQPNILLLLGDWIHLIGQENIKQKFSNTMEEEQFSFEAVFDNEESKKVFKKYMKDTFVSEM